MRHPCFGKMEKRKEKRRGARKAIHAGPCIKLAQFKSGWTEPFATAKSQSTQSVN